MIDSMIESWIDSKIVKIILVKSAPLIVYDSGQLYNYSLHIYLIQINIRLIPNILINY